MLQQEIYKLFKRKLVWVMLLIIFFYVLYDGLSQIKLYYFDKQEGPRLQYELEKWDAAKGILTDEKLESFIEDYQMAEYDAFDNGFLDENGELEKVDELFPNINFDLQFGYYEYWPRGLDDLRTFIKCLFAFVVVVFSSAFTYEKECGTQEILLSTKKGRKQYTKAKVATAFLVTNLLCFIGMILTLAPLFILTKGVGWDTSIQMTNWMRTSTLDMNYLELLFHSIFLSVLAINVILFITLAASFLANSPVAAMCACFGILFFIRPDMMDVSLNNDIANFITALTPFNVFDGMNLVDQIPIQSGGIEISCLTVAEVVYSLLLAGGGVFFFRVLTKHQTYYAS